MFNVNFCQWLDSNRGPLEKEATALPTEPQPTISLSDINLFQVPTLYFSLRLTNIQYFTFSLYLALFAVICYMLPTCYFGFLTLTRYLPNQYSQYFTLSNYFFLSLPLSLHLTHGPSHFSPSWPTYEANVCAIMTSAFVCIIIYLPLHQCCECSCVFISSI